MLHCRQNSLLVEATPKTAIFQGICPKDMESVLSSYWTGAAALRNCKRKLRA